MSVSSKDLAILDKFEFDTPPVGIKYTFKRPQGIKRLDEKTTLCTMLKRAQEGNAFYADKYNFSCGSQPLGMDDSTGSSYALVHSGEFDAALKVWEEPRAGATFKNNVPRLWRGAINYASFASLKQISFDPDLVIIVTNDTNQLMTLMRAVSWRTGELWETKFSPILGCTWIFSYPVMSGRVNYGLFGLSHGMGRRKLFPAGLLWVSIPYQKLPEVLQSLREIHWVLPSFADDKFFDRTRDDLLEELPEHIVA